jgi:hypothetical protein
MVSVIVLYLWRASPLEGFVFPVSRKPLSDLHANGQLRCEHAQVGADLAVENLSEFEIVEVTQTLSEQAGYQQRRREPFRRDARTLSRPLLFHEFMNVQRVTRPKYTDQKHRMATCNPLSSNDLRMANFRLPSVYFRR